MTPIYRLTPDLSEVVQQSTMKEPPGWTGKKHMGSPLIESESQFSKFYDEHKEYWEHLAALPRFPARGFTEKWLGVDIPESEIRIENDCELHPGCYCIMNGKNEKECKRYNPVAYPVAVAVPATEETGCKIGIFEHNKSIFHLGQCHSCYSAKVIESPIAGASSTQSEKEKEILDLKEQLRKAYVWLEIMAEQSAMENPLKKV